MIRPATIRSASLPNIDTSRGSLLLSRSHFANAHGYTHGGKRNLRDALGYPASISPADYLTRYRRGGIAKRIVKAYPNATWPAGAIIYEEEDPEVETDFERAVAALFTRLNQPQRGDVWTRFRRADIQRALGEYSVIVIGAPGAFDTELPRLTVDRILYLDPYLQSRVSEIKYVEDVTDPRFGLPLSYKINFGKTSSGTQLDRIVHWSRVIHVSDDHLDNDVMGLPDLEAVNDLLEALDKIVHGGAEAAWNRMDPGVHASIPMFHPKTGEVIQPVAVEEIEEQFELRRHGLKRDIYTQGVEITPLSASVNAFGGNADAIVKLISATTGIPYRILTGSERGELASTQDDDNWNDRVQERRREFAVPLIGQFIDRLITYGALPKPAQWDVAWPESDELDELGKAQLMSTLASANAAQMQAEGRLILNSAEMREMGYDLEPLDEPDETDIEDELDLDDDTRSDDEGTELSVNARRRLRAAEYDLADTPSDEPEWRAIHRAADSHLPTMARLFRGLWQDAADELDGPEIEEYLSRGATYAVYSRIDNALREAESRLLGASGVSGASGVLSGRLLSVLTDGALASLRSARARGGWRSASVLDNKILSDVVWDMNPSSGVLDKLTLNAVHSSPLDQVPTLGTSSLDTSMSRPREAQSGVEAASTRDAITPAAGLYQTEPGGSLLRGAKFSTSFDATNPRAVSFADTRSASLVTQIGTDTRAALRELVAAGLRDGIAPAKLRQYIRQSVGLRTDQLLAVSNLRARLAAAKPGSTVRAGKVRIKVPKSGASARFIDDKAAKYSAKLLNDRAMLIARTETMNAANAGQLELWKQAQEGGTLPLDAKRRWLETPDDRLRHSHAIMAGQEVGINEPFDPPIEPGSEPACRCSQGIA